jgi:hypothetical protein
LIANARDLLASTVRATGARPHEIDRAENAFRIRLPEDYRHLLAWANGAEGFVGESYLSLWPVDSLPELNAAAGSATFVPGVVLVGTDGGDTVYGITSSERGCSWMKAPLVGLGSDMLEVRETA